VSCLAAYLAGAASCRMTFVKAKSNLCTAYPEHLARSEGALMEEEEEGGGFQSKGLVMCKGLGKYKETKNTRALMTKRTPKKYPKIKIK
jgi:hypothetical protein